MPHKNDGWMRRIKNIVALRWHLGLLFNVLGTHIPSHSVRQAWLRLLGARIGSHTSILRGTTVHDPAKLVIGYHCSIGFRCVLDARGGITIGNNVTLSSDVHLITADHDIDAPDFAARLAPIALGDRVWLASRATVLKGVTVGEGAVVAAGGVAVDDVEAFVVVGGVPARALAKRSEDLSYMIDFRPRFF